VPFDKLRRHDTDDRLERNKFSMIYAGLYFVARKDKTANLHDRTPFIRSLTDSHASARGRIVDAEVSKILTMFAFTQLALAVRAGIGRRGIFLQLQKNEVSAWNH
jgi:hypothetical protein